MKDTTMRNCMLKILGCAFAVLLASSCEGPLSASKQEAATGRAIIRIGETSARSLVPTAVPDFTKYELVFTSDGKTDVTRTLTTDEDRTAINDGGYTVELEEATWTVAVSAFVSGADDTYLEAALGSGSLTVNAATPNPSVTITLDPLAMNGTAKGTFTWNLDLSGVAGDTSVSGTIAPDVDLVLLPSFNTAQTLSGATGSLELASGFYDLAFTVTKDGKSAGIYQTVHIYPGLTTTAEGEDFTFTDADFAEQKNLAGTVRITGVPAGKTVEWVKVRPYQDSAFTTPLAEEASTTQNGAWLFTIPAETAAIYFKVTMKLTGSAVEYDAPGASVTGVPANGRKDIALSLTYRAIVTFNTGEGSAIDPVIVDAGSTVNKPVDPARTGYHFDDWYTAETGGSAVSWPLTVSENTTVYARWFLVGQGSIKVSFSGLPQDETTNLTGAPAGTLSWRTGTLNLSVPEANFPDATWQWYLDNAPLSGATNSSLNKAGSDFTPGRHEVTVEILMTDGKMYSKTLRFMVGQ